MDMSNPSPVGTQLSARDQFLSLLGQGMEPSEATRLLGLAPIVLTELLQDSDFKKELSALRRANRQEIIEDSYAKLESKTLRSLEKDLENDGMVTITEKTKILETVSRNRVAYRNPAAHYQNPTAHLTIEVKVPQGAASQGVTIEQSTGQIIAIGERSMAGMPIGGVRKLFKEFDKEEELAKQAPAPAPLSGAELAHSIHEDIDTDDSDAHIVVLEDEQANYTAAQQARSIA